MSIKTIGQIHTIYPMKIKEQNGNIILEKEMPHVTHAIVPSVTSVHKTKMNEIRNQLSDYFAKKAEDAIDRLWDEGKITEETIESWKHEHMRIPYK